MFFYVSNDNLLICKNKINHYNNITDLNLIEIDENKAQNFNENLYILNKLNPEYSRRSFCTTNHNVLYLDKEDLSLLKNSKASSLPIWLKDRINDRKVMSLNTEYKSFKNVLNEDFHFKISKGKTKINVVGLGDVGGTLITGLRLLGSECVENIGIYDKDINKMIRWEFEGNQISSLDNSLEYPEIVMLKEDELFNCDMFVFCVSVGVPKVGDEKKDVRISQFNGNSKVISFYANIARKNNFKGIFAVVSDPVDLLCKSVFDYSNKDLSGHWDFNGLAPEQIRGYGLGVMNARALYYSKNIAKEYKKEGRAFGPHGEGLIIANSIENYDDNLSSLLTNKTKNANLQLRNAGFKPYIAPALSSGALSLINTIKGNWNYSANFLGGTFFGCKNRLTNSGTELETLDFPKKLFNRLEDTYTLLDKLYKETCSKVH